MAKKKARRSTASRSAGLTIPSKRQCAISGPSADGIRALIEDLSDEPELSIVGLVVRKGTEGAFRLVVKLTRTV